LFLCSIYVATQLGQNTKSANRNFVEIYFSEKFSEKFSRIKQFAVIEARSRLPIVFEHHQWQNVCQKLAKHILPNICQCQAFAKHILPNNCQIFAKHLPNTFCQTFATIFFNKKYPNSILTAIGKPQTDKNFLNWSKLSSNHSKRD
jgi:hypothetical protein